MTNSSEHDVQGFDDAPRKKFKMPKWAIVTLCILAVLIVIALIVPSFLDQNKYKGLVIQKVADATGYTVAWEGDLGISILPMPHVTIRQATLANGTQKILSIKQADISVELMPLLDKQIQISSVKLIEPDINLSVDASGRQTWMTDKLQAQKKQSEAAPENPASEKKTAQSIMLDSIHIEKGHIVYKDLSKGSAQDISNLNTDFSLKDLTRPFDAKADFVYNGNEIALKGTAGKMVEGQPTAMDFDIELPKLNVKGNYKGAITTGAAMSVKGDLKLSAKDLEKTMATLGKADTKLPEGLNGALDLTAAVLYDGDNAGLDRLSIALGDLSYNGSIKIAGMKTTQSPKLTIDLSSMSKKAKAKNTIVKILSDLSVKGAGTFANNIVTIDQSVIAFNGQAVNLSGSYALPKQPNARPRLNATIKADRLNIDELTNQIGSGEAASSTKTADAKPEVQSKSDIKGVALPFDGVVAGSLGNVTYGGKAYSNVNFNISNNGQALTINNLSVNMIADTSVAVRGRIANLEKLSGLDINANVKTGNVEALAKAYNAPLKLEQAVGAAAMAGNFGGSLENLSFNATVDALNFAVTGVGSVQSPLNNPQIEKLNLRVRHPSLQAAVRNFSPGFEAPGSFNGPLDVSTTLALKGKKYDLTNIKGNLGSIAVAGQLSADLSGAKASVKGDLSFGNMLFDSPQPKAGTATASAKPSSAPATSSETRWSREAIDTSWMTKFNADLSIKAATITQGLYKLGNAVLAFKLNDGTLTIDDMSANAFAGKIAINGKMKGGDAKAPLSMNWAAKASDLNAQMLLSALQNKPTDTLSGTIKSFNVDVASSGLSPAALIYGLSGKGSATGNNLVVKGVDAAKLAETARGSFKPLERAGSLLNSFKDGQTAFSDFNANFTIANGMVNFSQIKFDGAQATLLSTGNVNLPRWTIDLKNNMTVKNSDVPPFDFAISGPLDQPLQTGGSVIEGYLRQKAQAKIEKLITDKLGSKLGLPAGILGGTTAPAAPAADAANPAATTAPVEKTKEQKKQEQIQEGVKALQGLFGK